MLLVSAHPVDHASLDTLTHLQRAVVDLNGKPAAGGVCHPVRDQSFHKSRPMNDLNDTAINKPPSLNLTHCWKTKD
jgi:hypothetical protein